MVYASDGIRRSLQIMQDGRIIESASSRADFHFEEAESALRFYLPKDEADREVCFESDLPRRLCTFLGITDPGASGILGGVFRKDNLVVIDRILEKAGVGRVDCNFAALDEELRASEADSDNETLIEAISNIRLFTPGSNPRSYTPSGSAKGRKRHSGSQNVAALDEELRAAEAESDVGAPREATSNIGLATPPSSRRRQYTSSGWSRWREGPSGSEPAEDVHDAIMSGSSHQERERDTQETAYKRILENAVNVARQRVHSGVFESTGVSIESPVATEALPQEIIREAFATRTQERDFKVGAAGELYMFEYLKGLGLEEFSLENWKSGIRDRVKIHADYQDLEKDTDRSAIADIEYLDDSGGLTQFLIQKGHLAQALWNSGRPFYHIEIKTTTSSDWQEPFFMSKAQERHVRTSTLQACNR